MCPIQAKSNLTPDPGAYEAYRRGKRLLERIYHALKPESQSNDVEHVYTMLCDSVMLFTQSIELDNTWIAALNGRAEAYFLMSRLVPSDSKDALERALGDYDTVIITLYGFDELLEETLHAGTQDWFLTALQGRAYLLRKTNFKQAITDLDECIRQSPRIRFWLMKAEIQFFHGQLESSLRSWMETMRLFCYLNGPVLEEHRALYKAVYVRLKAIPESATSHDALPRQIAILQEFWSGTNVWNH
jgi:hypothetical protein